MSREPELINSIYPNNISTPIGDAQKPDTIGSVGSGRSDRMGGQQTPNTQAVAASKRHPSTVAAERKPQVPVEHKPRALLRPQAYPKNQERAAVELTALAAQPQLQEAHHQRAVERPLQPAVLPPDTQRPTTTA
ncbi:MAG: hypothetical protein HQK98_08175 [Nitrospirae bacterium]|nr:hypothetical protein [Nitrospirota bacterium]